jgi:hypothetical protein
VAQQFPSPSGISNQVSPCELILCHCLEYKKQCSAPFGTYCEVHEDYSSTNSMEPCGIPAICLGSIGNLQGTYHFLSLVMGQLIKRCHWDELLIPQADIDV